MSYFPSKLAKGKAFINRTDEQKQVLQCIHDITPLLVMSPRRYGKTSLITHVLDKNKIIYSIVDLYMELTAEDIAKAILKGIGQILGQIEKTPKRLLSLATEFFSSLQIEAVIRKAGIEIQFGMKNKKPAEMIALALEKLEELAKKQRKIVVLFLDEFQVLGEVLNDYSIEAAIRHAAQQSEYVEYIFSGSNRHLLSQIFSDKKKPLYKICHTLPLDRISRIHYETYIKKVSPDIWGKQLDDETITTILSLTERHSYYVNRLCYLLSFEKFPTTQDVHQCWQNYVLSNKTAVENELANLTVNQKILLINIARNELTKELHSKTFTEKLPISSGSISRTVNALLEKDYLYIDEQGYYKVLDPLMQAILI